MIAAAVVTVSDTCYQGSRADASGPAVAERLRTAGFAVTSTTIVPDERSLIAKRLQSIAEAGKENVIFTTGGTGVATRDVTPEATRDVITREIPGLGELMRARGREKTLFSDLSRAIAGIRNGVLIVNLPGSPKGAVESLDAILELVPHVLDLINGHTGHPEA